MYIYLIIAKAGQTAGPNWLNYLVKPWVPQAKKKFFFKNISILSKFDFFLSRRALPLTIPLSMPVILFIFTETRIPKKLLTFHFTVCNQNFQKITIQFFKFVIQIEETVSKIKAVKNPTLRTLPCRLGIQDIGKHCRGHFCYELK